MKKMFVAAMVLAVVVSFGCKTTPEPEVVVAPEPEVAAETNDEAKLETLSQKASYAVGTQMGQSLTQFPVDLDRASFDAGFEDGLAKKESRLSQEEMMSVFREMQTKAQEKAASAGKINLEKGKAFLAENAKKKGVKTTASGLQYKVVRKGKGKKPARTNRVVVHYEGKTLDGNVFDSSYARNKPNEFAVGGVIPGWTEALLLMKIGSKYQLFIPSDIAYGPRGQGRDIGPNEVLIFDVELLDIK